MATIGSVALDGQNDAFRDSGGTPGRPFGAGHRVPGPDLPDRLTQPGRREVGGPRRLSSPPMARAPPGNTRVGWKARPSGGSCPAEFLAVQLAARERLP